jgi:hypothetical protein
MEAYGNVFNCSNSSQGCPSPVGNRSGVTRSFLNTYTRLSGSWFNNFFSVSLFRTWAGFQPWGYCNGLGLWDTNDGIVYASGTITGVTTSGGLTVTDSTKTWTANQWVNNGAPYSIVDTSINDTTQGQSPANHPSWEITSGGANSVSSNMYGSDYYNGPPVPAVGHTYQILRATVCIDQPTRSGGTLLTGTPTPGAVNQALDPSYEWGDTMTDGSSPNQGAVASQTAKLIPNRDFYAEVSQSIQISPTTPFNGTVGTGYGALTNRPTTCTTGVGYYATDQGSWNTKSVNFPGQNFSQGQLYICTATNTWTLSYTPYTYPHPLTSGTAPAAPPPPAAAPDAPTNLQTLVH